MNDRTSRIFALLATGLAVFSGARTSSAQTLDRTVLPIPEPQPPTITELSARDAKAPARFEVRAPAGAPNVVIVLLDDIGFGQSSAFGGPIRMATLDKLASEGLRYNNFHTTSLCSPTRVALLTGRNHHVNNAGAIMELATGFPGNTGIRPQSVAPLAEMLRLNGYSTAAFGKYHETPPWEVSVSGPFDRWPTHSGFDKFYGFIGGETNQWAPAIYDGTIRVEHAQAPDYHFTVDMTDQALAWMQAQHSLTPDKPFFVYFATGALHAPHHVPKEYIDRYKGQFDRGWDALRQETFARQKKMGVIPSSADLTVRPKEIPSWDSQTAAQKKIEARQMETFAGFGEHTDEQVGRLVQALQDMGVMDNTLFIYIVGDNGASAEGGPEGAYNEMMALNGIINTAEINMPHLDDWGGPKTFPHYAIGWAWAGDTPFQWTKQIASHYGGTTNGIVIRWPARIRKGGAVRSQFTHVNDIAPTVLEAANLPFPRSVNGTVQKPFDGTSMLYTFDNPAAPEMHTTQYFEMFGNRGIYHDGWIAAARHSIPWLIVPLPPLTADTWELYHTAEDFSEAHDVAAKNPAKLKEMQDLFLTVAVQNHVLPIDDRRSERFDAKIAGRPDLLNGRTTMTVYPGMTGIGENAFINVKNTAFAITASVELSNDRTNGVIIAQAGAFGGWALYMKDGIVHHEYNYFGVERTNIAGSTAVPAGKHEIRYEFVPDGPKPGAGGTGTLFVDRQKVAQGHVPKTQPYMFSADEGTDVGMDGETAVSNDYKPGGDSRFTGKIVKVTIELKPSVLSAADRKAVEDAAQAAAVDSD
ncbi:MAG TPA: arylsulfatase [Thermoanaerobaculia bacterium]|nr:arylsulfatase [Thermoanaerobaculia bacterium]